MTTSKSPSGRVKRTPIGSRNKLSVSDRDPNYHYRIVNTNMEGKEDRVEMFKEQGYEVVPNTNVGDKSVDRPSRLGSGSEISVGQGVKAVLMRIPKEYFEEDQAAKQQRIDDSVATMDAETAKRK